MTKKQLLDLIAEYPDDAEVVIEGHDTTLHEDLYEDLSNLYNDNNE